MADKKYNDQDGVWRTIGGRRVFIKNGQDLASAMRESGKFNFDGDKKQQEKVKEFLKETGGTKEQLDKDVDDWINGSDYKDGLKKFEQKFEEYQKSLYDENGRFRESDDSLKISEELRQLEKEYGLKGKDIAPMQQEIVKKYDKISAEKQDKLRGDKPYKSIEQAKEEWLTNKDKDWLDKQGHSKELDEKIKNFKPSGDIDDDSRRLEDISSNYFYDEVGIYNENIDSVSSKWSHDKAVELNSKPKANIKTITQEEYDKMPKDYKGTLKELVDTADFRGEDKEALRKEYEAKGYDVDKDKTILELTNGGTTLRPVKIANKESDDKHAGWELYSDDPHRYDDTIKSAQARKEKFKADDEFKKSHHMGWGNYNKDGVPVYNNDIDYKGDFGLANLETLSNDDLTKALNVQSEEYHKASNESVGDGRTRNGKMNQIFKGAKVNQYERGMNKINEEMSKRDMPRYNIYNEKNGMLLVSSPTKEMADKQIQEMIKSDLALQKEYNWKDLPKYVTRVQNKEETENGFSGKNQISNALQSKAYEKYKKEHPKSKMTLADFLKKK